MTDENKRSSGLLSTLTSIMGFGEKKVEMKAEASTINYKENYDKLLNEGVKAAADATALAAISPDKITEIKTLYDKAIQIQSTLKKDYQAFHANDVLLETEIEFANAYAKPLIDKYKSDNPNLTTTKVEGKNFNENKQVTQQNIQKTVETKQSPTIHSKSDTIQPVSKKAMDSAQKIAMLTNLKNMPYTEVNKAIQDIRKEEKAEKQQQAQFLASQIKESRQLQSTITPEERKMQKEAFKKLDESETQSRRLKK